VAGEGFWRLLSATRAGGEGPSDDELAGIAQRVLLAESARAPSAPNINAMINAMDFGYGGPRVELVERLSAAEFLVRRAWKAQDFATIENELLPALETAKNKACLEELRAEVDLHRCAPEDFIETAKRHLKRADKRQRIPIAVDAPVSKVIGIWSLRALEIDLEPWVLERAKKAGSTVMFGRQSPRFLAEWARMRAADGGTEAAAAFLEKLAALWIGPPEERAELVAKHLDSSSFSSGSINARIQAYFAFLVMCIRETGLTFPALDSLDALGAKERQYRWEVSSSLTVRIHSLDTVEEVVAFLEESPLLGPLDEFRTYAQDLGDDESVLGTIVAWLAQRPEKHAASRSAVRKALAAREQKTFGQGLVVALLGDDMPNAHLEYIAGWSDRIDALPPEHRERIARFVAGLSSSARQARASRQSAKLSDAARAALEWTKRTLSGETESALTRLEKTERLRDLDVETYDFPEYVADALRPVVGSDRDRAFAALEHATKLWEKGVRRSGVGRRELRSFPAGVVRELLSEGDLDTVGFAFAAIVRVPAVAESAANILDACSAAVRQALGSSAEINSGTRDARLAAL